MSFLSTAIRFSNFNFNIPLSTPTLPSFTMQQCLEFFDSIFMISCPIFCEEPFTVKGSLMDFVPLSSSLWSTPFCAKLLSSRIMLLTISTSSRGTTCQFNFHIDILMPSSSVCLEETRQPLLSPNTVVPSKPLAYIRTWLQCLPRR